MTSITIITSTFNQTITQKLTDEAHLYLKQKGIADATITLLTVPGAVELPFAAQCAIQAGSEGVIIFGSVIRGDTNHYDYVCQQVSYGCQRIMLTHHTPVIFGVLTTDTFEQAMQRADGTVYNVGRDCADTLLTMMALKADTQSELQL